MRSAAGGQCLAEAIPVVDDFHPRIIGAYRHRHALFIRVIGADIDPVGIQRTGGVELAAVQLPVAAVQAQAGAELKLFGIAHFAGRRADCFATPQALQPHALVVRVATVEQVFTETEVPAQRLHQVGVGLGQFDQQVEQFRQAGTGTAVFLGHTQGGEAGLLEPLQLLERQAPFQFAFHGTFTNLREDRPKAGCQCFVSRRRDGAPG